MRSYWISMGPECSDRCPEEEARTQTHRGEAVWPWGQVGVMRLQAKECRGPSAATGSWAEARHRPPLRAPGRTHAAHVQYQMSGFQNSERTSSCASRPHVCGHLLQQPADTNMTLIPSEGGIRSWLHVLAGDNKTRRREILEATSENRL